MHAWRLSGSFKRMAQIFLRKLGLEWSLRERGFYLKKGWFKVYSSELSGQLSWGGRGGPFIAPRKKLPVGVLETWACPVSGAGHVRYRDWICSERFTVTRLGSRISPARDLAIAKKGLARTCSVQEPNMSGNSYWNLAQDPDKSR
jgi:hypothetical protein